MESRTTPRDDDDDDDRANKCARQICQRELEGEVGNGREVEQYAHRLGAVVSQFIVDSLGCPCGRGRTMGVN